MADTTTTADGYVHGGRIAHSPRRVLCLGVSYVDLTGAQTVTSATADAGVSQVVECVRRNIVTAMDGRDLARCRATEHYCNAELYTVSQESGGRYRTNRHLHGNFNRRNFLRKLQEHFLFLEFDQVMLDYFWIPAGWDESHWQRDFFAHTLVELAKQDVVPYRTPIPGELVGSVILPFCYHVFKEVIGSFSGLRNYYDVSFLRKNELHKVPLWKGTQEIDAGQMQYFLEKRRDQEELYCTFRPRDVNEAGRCRSVPKSKIVDLARRLEDFADIRFIILTRLAPTDKGTKARRGNWVGLEPARQVVRGYDSLAAGSTRQLPPPPHQPIKKRKAEVAPTGPKRANRMQCTFQRPSPLTVLDDALPLQEEDGPEVVLEPFVDESPASVLERTTEPTIYPCGHQPEAVIATDVQLL